MERTKTKPGSTSRRRRTILILVSVAAALLVIGAGGVFGMRGYRAFQANRSLQKAKTLLESKDYPNAALFIRRVLTLDPMNIEASRTMAQIMDEAGVPQAINWWRKVAQLQPGDTATYLKWAAAALRFNEIAMAREALGQIDDEGKNTAGFHNVAGRVADAAGKPQERAMHLAEAVKLEPENKQYQLDEAISQLFSEDSEARATARMRIHSLAGEPKLRRAAYHALIKDAIATGQNGNALALANKLQASTDATFQERLAFLGMLRQVNHPAFTSHLDRLQKDSETNPDQVSGILNWLNANGMALTGIEWYKRLPAELRSRGTVPPTITQSYALLGDWDAVKRLVTGGKWEQLEFSRLAFLAKILRDSSDERGFRDRWNAAVKAASPSSDALAILVRNAFAWGWEGDGVDVLWSATQQGPHQQWALHALQQRYQEKRDTRGLLRVASRMLEIKPDDVIAKNNVASLSLLVNANLDRAYELAQQAYAKQPQNPGIISTYAFALHRRGKNAEALKLMAALNEKQMQDPSYAAYQGIFLASEHLTDEAQQYLDIAERGNLLPEEQALVAEARNLWRTEGNSDALNRTVK